VDVHRRRRRFPEEPGEEKGGETAMGLQEGACLSPEAVLLQEEREECVRQRIFALPPPLRAPSTLRFLQELSYDDIATRLDLTNCNIRKRIQHSCRILRVELGCLREGSP
jgi:DNA-directed RNA polymerase specialized sigma24 family protein